MSRFLSDRFSSLETYVPGEQPKDMEYVKLNTNESPFPPSPKVLERLNEQEIAKLNLYPQPEGAVLSEKLAQTYGVERENVFLANGSDEVLSFAFMAFCDSDTGAAFPDISYGFYPVFAQLYGIDYSEKPLCDDFTIDINDYFSQNRTIFIANPNAPTGLALTRDQIEKILQTNPDNIVVIDEAYVDFGGETAIPLIKRYPNLLVVQTYSKSRSMAGARLGYGIADAEIIEDLNKIKFSNNPYNINRLTMAAGEAALDDAEYYASNCREIIRVREYTAEKLRELGFELTDSKANFLFAKTSKMHGSELYKRLKEKGVLIRYLGKKRIEDYVRITIGTQEQMDILLCAIKEILGV